jgi:beta-N-acetylhexosaminidase
MKGPAAGLMLVLCLAAACTQAPARPVGSPSTSAPVSISPSEPSPSPSETPTCAQQVLATMTEEQRVGQLFIVGLAEDRLGPDEIAGIQDHHFGSVSFIVTTSGGVDGVRAVTDAVRAQVSKKATAKVGFYIAANQEGGQIQALRGPGFSSIPTAVAQGQLSPDILERDAAEWGGELQDAGVNFNFAPVMDVVPPGQDSQNEPIGVLQREYGHDPKRVGNHGVAVIQGMQEAGVATSAKHFPGLGRVEGNTDFTADVVDDITTPDDPYLATFQRAIDAGVPFVMVALATYELIDPDNLAVFSPTVMKLLRDTMGFTGVIVSDDIGSATAVAGVPVRDRAIDFLEAGGDMVISKTVQSADVMAAAVLSRASTVPSFRGRVDDAVLRILEAKDASGLLPCSAG